MKHSLALLAVALALGSPAQAADRTGFYAGASVGISKTDIDQGAVDSAVLGAFESLGLDVLSGDSEVDDTDASLGFIFGYRILPYLAVEAEYLTLGTPKYDAAGDVTDGMSVVPVSVGFETDSKGVAVSALGIWPVARNWDVYARVGAFFANTSTVLRVAAEGESAGGSISENSEEFLFGAGADYIVSPKWSIRLDYQRLFDVGEASTTGEADVDRLTLAWLYSF